jgi:hypothetical protein
MATRNRLRAISRWSSASPNNERTNHASDSGRVLRLISWFDRLCGTRMNEQQRMRKQLLEAMAWCAPRVDHRAPKTSLRSDELRPRAEYDEDGLTIWTEPPMIDHVVGARERLTAGVPKVLLRGRLLLCYHDENNHNWAAAEASQWFFDGHDNPPWDTWVGRCDDALVGWVPPEFVHLAQEGIDTECVGMLDWADGPPRLEWRTTPVWLKDLAIEVRDGTSSADGRRG